MPSVLPLSHMSIINRFDRGGKAATASSVLAASNGLSLYSESEGKGALVQRTHVPIKRSQQNTLFTLKTNADWQTEHITQAETKKGAVTAASSPDIVFLRGGGIATFIQVKT